MFYWCVSPSSMTVLTLSSLLNGPKFLYLQHNNICRLINYYNNPDDGTISTLSMNRSVSCVEVIKSKECNMHSRRDGLQICAPILKWLSQLASLCDSRLVPPPSSVAVWNNYKHFLFNVAGQHVMRNSSVRA